jgi:CHASE3 domain sensor protein
MMNGGKLERRHFSDIIRLLFVTKYAIILIALFLVLFFGIQSSNRLLKSLQILSEPDQGIVLIENGIIKLYKADNNFRTYLLNWDKNYYEKYKENLNSISIILDSINDSKQSEHPVQKAKSSLTE